MVLDYIAHGRAEDLCGDLLAGSIDLVLTEPPYFFDQMSAGWSHAEIRRAAAKAEVVGGLPVGMRFDRRQSVLFGEFNVQVIPMFFRVLKPGAFLVSFSQGRLYQRMAVTVENAGFEIHDQLVWKHAGQAKAFSRTHFIRRLALPGAAKDAVIAELAGWNAPAPVPVGADDADAEAGRGDLRGELAVAQRRPDEHGGLPGQQVSKDGHEGSQAVGPGRPAVNADAATALVVLRAWPIALTMEA